MTASTENKEALTVPDDTKDIETNRVNEKVFLEENTTIIKRNTYGNSFILGSSSNGVLGTDGLGESGRVLTTLAVVNVNNTFRGHFSDTTFEDTGVTTADWSDTVGQLDFTNTEIAQSTSIAAGGGTIVSAKIFVTVSSGDIADLTFELSADGGSNFESVTHNVEHSFTDTGTDLKFKITAAGTVTVTLVKVSYT